MKKKSKQDEITRVLRVSAETHAEFKAMCAKEGKLMSWVTEQIIKDYLEKRKDIF